MIGRPRSTARSTSSTPARPTAWSAGPRSAWRESLEPERVEHGRVAAGHHLGHLAADADHLVAVVRVGDDVHVRAHVVEDREAVGGEAADAARAHVLVRAALTLEPLHAVG